MVFKFYEWLMNKIYSQSISQMAAKVHMLREMYKDETNTYTFTLDLIFENLKDGNYYKAHELLHYLEMRILIYDNFNLVKDDE